MRKEDFLEILKDYLKNSFSQEEIMEIVRDYEEYFVDGEIEGKSEIEIIASLGSPKEIAKELVAQSSDKNTNKSKFKNKFEDMYIALKGKSKTLLSKLRVNLKDKNHVKNRNTAKYIQKLLRIIEIPFKLVINIGLICFALTLIGLIVGPILLAPFITSFMSVMPELKMVVVFGIIGYIGLEILLWQLFFIVFKLLRKLKKAYKNYLDTNDLYIKGSIKKEAREQDGGLLDE